MKTVATTNLRGGITILGKDNKVITDFGTNKNKKLVGNFKTEVKDWKDDQFTISKNHARE